MVKYDLRTISFLISSFRDIITTFGENSKSVEFYKRQVNQLISIGQVSLNDQKFIEELIGMSNTNSVKWDKANEKLMQFIEIVNETNGYNDFSKVIIIGRLLLLSARAA